MRSTSANTNADADVDLVLRAIRQLALLEQGFESTAQEPDLVVTRDDLARELGLDVESRSLARGALLLRVEHWGAKRWSTGPQWSLAVSRDVRRFRMVTSSAEYGTARAQWRDELSGATPAVSGSPPPVSLRDRLYGSAAAARRSTRYACGLPASGIVGTLAQLIGNAGYLEVDRGPGIQDVTLLGSAQSAARIARASAVRALGSAWAWTMR